MDDNFSSRVKDVISYSKEEKDLSNGRIFFYTDGFPETIVNGEEVRIEETVEEVSNTSKKNKQVKNHNPLGVGIFVLISGIFGLFASSLIFNFVSESFNNQTPKQEPINKTTPTCKRNNQKEK